MIQRLPVQIVDKINKIFDWLESNLLLFFLAGLAGVTPFVVYMRVVTYDAVAASIYGRPNTVDFFTFYRAYWIYIFAGFGMLVFFWQKKMVRSRYFLGLFSYLFLNSVSAVFSQHWQIAFWGDPTRHEGLFVHLCYMVCVFLFLNFVEDEGRLRKAFCVFFFSSLLLSIIGVLQFLGYDYFFGSFARTYLIPDFLRTAGVDSLLQGGVNPWNSIFLTFGNGNFTGSYMAMLFGLSLVFAIFVKNRFRLLFIGWHLLLFVNLFGSKSRAGILAGAASFILSLFFFSRKFKERLKVLIFLVVSYFLLVAGMEIYSVGSGKPGLLRTSVGRSASTPTGFWGNFDGVELQDDRASVSFDGLKMVLQIRDGEIDILNDKNIEVPYRLLPKSVVASRTTELKEKSEALVASGLPELKVELNEFSVELLEKAVSDKIRPALKNPEGTLELNVNEQFLVVFPEKEFRGYAVVAQPSINLFIITRGAGKIYLTMNEKGFRILNHNGQPAGIENAETFGFNGYEKFASGRGYIWSRTIPMLKKAILLGYGPDTFIAHFPHFDCVERMKHWGSMQIIMEKPHNMYLQIAVNSGVLSLIIVLLMFLCYCCDCICLYRNCSFDSLPEIVGLAAFMGFLAYCFAGLFNDSLNSVAPVFWSLFGLGLACNRLNSENSKCR